MMVPTATGQDALHLLSFGVPPDQVAERLGMDPSQVRRIARTNFPEYRKPRAPMTAAEAWAFVKRANNWLVGRYIARGLSDEQIRSLTDLPLAKVAEIRALRAA